MKKLLLITCLFLVPIAKAQVIKEFNVNFDTNSFELSEKESIKINSFLEPFFTNLNNFSVLIIGHTDNVGSLDFNYSLSNNRAKTIADYFENKGFDKTKIYANGRAYLKPTAKNTTEIGKAKNRRVTIKIYQKKKKNQILNGLNLKEKFYKINTSNEATIEYKSGTKITIPENAFVDKNGKPVTGIVDISYIEYRELVDFILGDIPMDYHDGKENFHFNSAGMFKILVTQNGDSIFLKDGKNILLNFKTTQELPNLNFYELNSKTKNWIELSKLTQQISNIDGDDLVQIKKIDTIFDCSVDSCKLFYFIKNTGIKSASSNESIYKNYHYNKAKDSVIISNLNKIRIKDSIKLIRQRDSIFELKNKIKFTRINLKIEIFNKRIDKNNAQIEGLNQKIKNLLINNSSNEIVADSIKKNKRKIQFNSMKTALNNKNIIFKNRIEELNKSKGTRGAIAQLPIVKNGFQYTKYYNCFWEENKKYMTITEQNLDIENWLRYFDSNKDEMLKRYSALVISEECQQIEKENIRKKKIAEEENKKQRELQAKYITAQNNANELTKSLSISNLGIYNCDQIQRLQKPIEIYAEYTDQNGKEINPIFIYLLDNKFNGIIRYDGFNNFSPYHFAFSPSSKNILLAFDLNGDSYIFQSEKFNKITILRKNKFTFIMTKITNLKSIDDLKSLL